MRFSVKQRLKKRSVLTYNKIFLFLVSLFLLPYPMASEALSANTANTIKGVKPYFTYDSVKIDNLDKLVEFSYKDTSGTIVEIDRTKSMEAKSSNEIIIPAGVKENGLITTVPFNVVADLDSLVKLDQYPLKVADEDGDALVVSEMGAKGRVSVSIQKNDDAITPEDTEFDPCSDYTLMITVSESGSPASVAATTKYGDPNDSGSDYVSIQATYKLRSEIIKMCYLAPLSLTIRPSSSSAYGGDRGYNPSLWVGRTTNTSKGFLVDEMLSSGKKFPQTGFKGARFKVVGSGSDQRNFECKLSSTVGIKQSPSTGSKATGKNCLIEYLGETKPTSGFTISLYYNPISTTVPVKTYTTPAPQLWAKMKDRIKYNTATDYSGTYTGAIACGAPGGLSGTENQAVASSYFFKRNEITNARNASVAPGSFNWITREYFIRDVSVTAPTILGEWDDLYSGYPYPNAGFTDDAGLYYIWASEEQSPTQQFRVNGVTGNIYTGLDPSDIPYTPLVVCRVN